MIGIDTFVWNKIIRILKTEWSPLMNEILETGDFFITHEGLTEFKYFYPDNLNLLNFVTILPVINIKFNKYKEMNFDANDASLLEYVEIKEYPVITEDHPMLSQGVSEKKGLIQLGDYFGFLYKKDFISSKELYHFTNLLKKWRNITNKKERELKSLRLRK